jgi:mannose-1-phosphate guanylyltransferase
LFHWVFAGFFVFDYNEEMEGPSFKKHLYALIICGGSGTRLWPVSRKNKPKQFSLLLGKKTLYQSTIERILSLVPYSNIFVVTTAEHGREIKKEAPSVYERNIFLEPMGKNTAMACGVGTLMIYENDPSAVVMNFWSDNLIKGLKNFKSVEMAAARVAFEEKSFVAIGVKPRYPHIGLGYIKAGKVFKNVDNICVYRLAGFIEKPNIATTKKLVKDRLYFWNSGMYVWHAGYFLDALRKYAKNSFDAVKSVVEGIKRGNRRLIKSAYEKVPPVSVDKAVSEKIKGAFIMPANFFWSDIGDWNTVYEYSSKDKEGNSILRISKGGSFVGIDCRNNLVYLNNKLIAGVGLHNLVIIDTEDALLICKRKDSQRVKELVSLIKGKKKANYL